MKKAQVKFLGYIATCTTAPQLYQYKTITIKTTRLHQSVHVLRPVPYGKLTVSTIKPTTSAPRIKLTISTPWIPISLVVVFLVRWWWYITVAAVD